MIYFCCISSPLQSGLGGEGSQGKCGLAHQFASPTPLDTAVLPPAKFLDLHFC